MAETSAPAPAPAPAPPPAPPSTPAPPGDADVAAAFAEFMARAAAAPHCEGRWTEIAPGLCCVRGRAVSADPAAVPYSVCCMRDDWHGEAAAVFAAECDTTGHAPVWFALGTPGAAPRHVFAYRTGPHVWSHGDGDETGFWARSSPAVMPRVSCPLLGGALGVRVAVSTKHTPTDGGPSFLFGASQLDRVAKLATDLAQKESHVPGLAQDRNALVKAAAETALNLAGWVAALHGVIALKIDAVQTTVFGEHAERWITAVGKNAQSSLPKTTALTVNAEALAGGRVLVEGDGGARRPLTVQDVPEPLRPVAKGLVVLEGARLSLVAFRCGDGNNWLAFPTHVPTVPMGESSASRRLSGALMMPAFFNGMVTFTMIVGKPRAVPKDVRQNMLPAVPAPPKLEVPNTKGRSAAVAPPPAVGGDSKPPPPGGGKTPASDPVAATIRIELPDDGNRDGDDGASSCSSCCGTCGDAACGGDCLQSDDDCDDDNGGAALTVRLRVVTRGVPKAPRGLAVVWHGGAPALALLAPGRGAARDAPQRPSHLIVRGGDGCWRLLPAVPPSVPALCFAAAERVPPRGREQLHELTRRPAWATDELYAQLAQLQLGESVATWLGLSREGAAETGAGGAAEEAATGAGGVAAGSVAGGATAPKPSGASAAPQPRPSSTHKLQYTKPGAQGGGKFGSKW